MRLLVATLLLLLLPGEVAWNMTVPPNPIEILYNATNTTKPSQPPRLELGNFSCKPPEQWWNIPGWIGYAGCSLAKAVSDAFKPFLEWIQLFIGYALTLVYNLGLLFINAGAVLITSFAVLVELIVWAVMFSATYIGDIIPWIPWIIVIAVFASLVDAANRAARERSIIPFFGFISMWWNMFERLFNFIKKAVETVMAFVKWIIDFFA